MISKFKMAAAGAALMFSASMAGAVAIPQIVSVGGTSTPWLTSDTLNTSFKIGNVDGTGPTIVKFSDIGIVGGAAIQINYLTGKTYAFGEGFDVVDQAGYVNGAFKNNNGSSTVDGLPSVYLPGYYGTTDLEGVWLNALVGAFTDDAGEIVGNPFAIGYTFEGSMGEQFYVFGVTQGTPVGATQVQLGMNDDIFSDNGGALRVCVGGSGACDNINPPAVPEPASWAMMIGGFGVAGGSLRARRQNAKVSFARV